VSLQLKPILTTSSNRGSVNVLFTVNNYDPEHWETLPIHTLHPTHPLQLSIFNGNYTIEQAFGQSRKIRSHLLSRQLPFNRRA
jgi:hypothetical protein